MNSEYDITTEAALREVLGEPSDKLADMILPHLDQNAIDYIGKSPLVFVATSNSAHDLDVSPKGDEPGFVQVEGNNLLLVPERPGNKLAFGFTNILETGTIGLIFVVPGIRETLRVNGRARISRDPALLAKLAAKGKDALLCTQVEVQQCFFHCGKAFIRSGTWNQDSWVKKDAKGMTKQLADSTGLDEQVVDQLIEDDYRDNLY